MEYRCTRKGSGKMALMRQIVYSSASTPLTPDTGSKYFDLAQFPTLEQVDSGTSYAAKDSNQSGASA